MKNINILILIALVLFFTGCKDKQKENIDTHVDVNKVTTPTKEELKALENLKKEQLKKSQTFVLTDINNNIHTIYMDKKDVSISDVNKSVVLLNFFSSCCQPCKGQIPYLVDLKEKYNKELFIAGILVDDTLNEDDLKKFIEEYGINYYISNSKDNDRFIKLVLERVKSKNRFSAPFSILLKDGKYYSHYESAVPVEMLNYDIKKAISKGK